MKKITLLSQAELMQVLDFVYSNEMYREYNEIARKYKKGINGISGAPVWLAIFKSQYMI